MFSVNTLSITMLVLCLIGVNTGKRLRLPILLRSPKIECSFTSDECGINQSLDHFELYQNSTFVIAGRCQYYQFAIKENYVPISVARFRTIFFPNLESTVGCLHVEYNAQGANTFLLAVSQKTHSKAAQIVYSNHVSHSSYWKSADIDVRLCEEESQFIFEVLCQRCSKGAMFSVSRVTFAWESCQ